MAGAFRSVAAVEGASVPKIHMSKSATPTVIYYNKYMSFYKDRVFWFIFAALALVKIVAFLGIYFFHPLGESVLSFPDSLSYVYPAVTLLQDGHLWDLYTVSPMLFRTPGYPVFLALVQLLFHNMTWAVALVQNVLSLLLLIPIYSSAKQLAGKGAARWATAFCAASTLYFSLSFAVLSEILCTFLLAWFVFFLLQFLINPQGKTLLCSALFLSAAVYVRPAAYYFFIPMTALLVCFALTRWIRFSIYKIGVCFLVPVLCLLGMWHLRNVVQTGFSGFTTVGAYNLYFWNSDYVAHKYHLSVQQAQTLLQEALPAGFSSRTPRQQNQIYKAAARPLLRASFTYKLTRAPWWAVKTLLGGNTTHLHHLLLGEEKDNHKKLDQLGSFPLGLHDWIYYLLFVTAMGEAFLVALLGATGLVLLWKKHKPQTFFLSVYCCYFWGIGSVFFGAYARFRAPFEFVLCVAAGVAAQACYKFYKKLQTKR